MHDPITKGILSFQNFSAIRFKSIITRSKHLTLCAELSVAACSIHFNVTFKITVAHHVFFCRDVATLKQNRQRQLLMVLVFLFRCLVILSQDFLA